MSLSNIITGRSFQRLRTKFKTVFPRPEINLSGDIIVPPLTDSNSIVGQAFDYLFRFSLEYRHKTKIKSSGGWVADRSYKFLLDKIELTKAKNINIGYYEDVVKDCKGFLEMLKIEYSNSKHNYQKYLSDGKLSDDLIKSSLFLARLDVTFRAQMIDENLGNENELDIVDLRKLMSIVNYDLFKVKNNCFVNPSFGIGSKFVGGADTDLIIDDTLIDLKVSKHLSVERKHLNQIIGYYILSLIGGVNGDRNLKPIKNIGLYFARHGVLWKIPLSKIADKKTILEFKDWFIIYIEQITGQSGRLDKLKKKFAEKEKAKNAESIIIHQVTRQTKKKIATTKKETIIKPKQSPKIKKTSR